MLHIDAIKKQHVQVYIQVERTAEMLNQCDGSGVCRGPETAAEEIAFFFSGLELVG